MPRALDLGRDINRRPQRLTPEERATHMHVLGASKKGKSRFLESLIRQDIRHGHGVCVIDPHGTLYDNITRWCARVGIGKSRHIHLIDPNDLDWTVGIDPLRCEDPNDLPYVVDSLVSACAQVWGGEDVNRTPLLKKCLRVVFYALAEKRLTLSDAIRLTTVSDPEAFRERVTGSLDDPIYLAVWEDLKQLRPKEFAETFASTNNRLIEFLGNPILRRMFSIKDGALDLKTCMDEGHVVLINLQPKRISRDNGRVVGTMITSALFALALQRNKDTSEKHPFYLYIDECYRYLTEDIEAMLDETRKYGLHVCLAHQRLSQLDRYGEHIRNAVLTNAQTKVVFGGLADEDADPLAREILRESFNYNRPKELLDKPVVTGYRQVWTRHFANARGEGYSEGSSSMAGHASGASMGEMVGQMHDDEGNPIGLQRIGISEGSSDVTSSASGHFAGSSHSTSTSEGLSEGFLPVLEMMHSAVEGEAEILHRAILQLRKLPARTYFLVRPEMPVTIVKTPTTDDARVLPSHITSYIETVRERSPFLLAAIDEPIGEIIDDDDPFYDDDGLG